MKKLLVFSFVFLSLSIFSQITTSKIKGIVTDSQGEPLFGANIVVLHEPTGTISGAVAQENGRYTIPNLRVGGPYKVTFSYIGFESQEVTNVYLTLGKTTNIDGILAEDGEQLEEVVISSTRSTVFNNDRTGAQTSVSAIQLKTLPTISRSAADFTRLEPTASGNSFGGRNDQFNNFSLDGSIFNNPFGLDSPTPGGQTGSQPISLDAIEQISVSTAPYDVTLSGFTGASVDAVTKSGTNEFTGTVYGFFRNQDMTGGKIKGQDVVKPKLSQSQYGASLGGPIVKDKLFFFANFEKDDREDLGTAGWVPNTGSGAINESRVSESDLMAVKNALSALGYDTGAYEGFTYGSESTKGIFKLDWNINDKNRLALIYNFLRASKEKPAHPTALGSRGPSFQTLQFEKSGYEINNNLNSFQLELNSNLSETTTNKLQVGYTHFDDYRNPMSAPAPVISIQDGNGSNYIIAGHEPFSINNRLDQKVFQLTNNMNFFQGDHTYTVGFSFEKFEFKNSFNLINYESFNFGIFPYYGLFSPYPDVATFLSEAQPGGVVEQYLAATQNAYNTFNANGAGNDGGWKLSELNVGQLAFYVQDEWEMNDKFKLTYGIRFDKPLYFNTSSLIQKFIDTDNGATRDNSVTYYNPNTGKEQTLLSTKMPTNQWLVSPRVGFNWDVKGDNTMQLRGGSGVFTGRLPFVWIGNQVSGADDGFFQLVDPDFKFPQVWRTNLGLDYKFENGIIATTDISYTKDINGAHVQNWGLREPSGTLNTSFDNRGVYMSGDKGNNAYVFTNSDKGRIWNASLKLQKTFDNGLYTSIAYNYLNAKDVNSIEAEITGDAFDFNPVVGNANNDVLAYSKYGDTHRIIGVASKKFTYGGDKFATTISTFFEYAKGGRFNYTYAGNINGDSSIQNNDLLYIPTSSEVQQMQFVVSGPNGETAQEQADAFEAYIRQDDYLSDNRGQYMERYGALAPWRGRWDLKILQDFNFNVSDKKQNTIQLSIDILNVGNLINSDWGVVQQPNNLSPLGVRFPDVDPMNTDPANYIPDYTKEPTYTFNTTQKETFGYDSSLLSRWQMQLGLRYIF
ncbi:outer membrane receptor protein involved in Fe transport [Tenacibaculum lutimaris]|uniref:Outer membrane receptor protein involved in Fe transport n=1 Tax=Tenacibaculum lutimaris TaxID=285258 RepID=A0A420E1P9_9FLAO|nr:carboxypeptidase regulatory-like domain-containing protein [Tenacibaculum lutimaris]RKF03797.1 outer membrane receptor protein involved in Fe transport [Tenacibaculum lutimaris]